MATFRDGQEAQSGTIRRDPSRLRCRRDDPRTGQEARRASTDGAQSNRERDPARTQAARTEATKDRSIEGCNRARSEEHTSELQSRRDLVCRLLLEKKKKNQ